MHKALAICLIFLGALWCVGCRSRSLSEEIEFQRLFAGYELLRIADIPGDKSLDEINGATLQGTYALAPRFVPGRVYVFRKVSSLQDEELALRVFPERLTEINARIVAAPKSAKDLAYLFIGGPLFKIEFEKDTHRGIIVNHLHTSEKTNETWEELLLFYS